MRRGRVRTGTELAWRMLALSRWRMRRTVAIAAAGVIALSLGAFGVPDGPETTTDLAAVLQTVEQSGVDLAALWSTTTRTSPSGA